MNKKGHCSSFWASVVFGTKGKKVDNELHGFVRVLESRGGGEQDAPVGRSDPR